MSEFSGSERTVAGYLLAEVLERQPPEARDLLLRTSILERVSGPLADSLTGGTGAEAILQRLEDQSAFVTALDAARTWFRYHHLFADLLRLELRRAAPATIPSLHRAAAAWHEQEGDVLEAVRHHQAAGDWAPAARLLLDNYLTLTMAGRGETLHALLGEFPADAHLGDGNLAAALSIDNILHGLLDEAAAQLEVARRLAAAVPAERRRVFQVYLAILDVELARRRSDLATAREATRELEAALGAAAEVGELPVPPDYWALALMNLGIVELWAGRPGDARQHLEDALGSHAPDLTALHRDRLPGAPRDRGAAQRAAAAARARAERAGDRDCRGAWLDQPVDDDRRVRDGRHGARADGALRGGGAPSRARGGVSPRGGRPRDRARGPPRPRHPELW